MLSILLDAVSLASEALVVAFIAVLGRARRSSR